MNKNFLLGLVLLVLAGFFVNKYLMAQQTANPKTVVAEDTTTPEAIDENEVKTDEAMMEKSYSLAEVEQHATAEDCWFVIEGKVYDVTGYIKKGIHPGGEAILMGCGKDATDLFRDRPNGSGSHSEKAESYLVNFYIGDLK